MDNDLAMVRAALAGEPSAADRLLGRIAGGVWTVCALLTTDETEARAAFRDVAATLRAQDFARLRGFDGRGRLDTYVTVATRDLLAERLVRLLLDDRKRGWVAFERFFAGDIRRLIQRRLPGAGYDEARRDAFQEICLALIEDNFRRLRAYGGTGSFSGFVLRTADRLVIDHVRQVTSRRRLPAAIARLPALEQELFKLVHWRQMPRDAVLLADALRQRIIPPPEPGAIALALEALQTHLPAADLAAGQRKQTVSMSALPADAIEALADDEGATPEDALADKQEADRLNAALGVLRQASAQLSTEEQLYLSVALTGAEPRPAREIAGLLRRPVGDVYKLKQRVLKRLKEILAGDSAVKNWLMSV